MPELSHCGSYYVLAAAAAAVVAAAVQGDSSWAGAEAAFAAFLEADT